jgi:hypothetical protein
MAENFGRPVFQNFQKKNPKNGLTRTRQMLKGTKSRKISPFEASTEESREIIYPRGFVEPCKIGLREILVTHFLALKAKFSLILTVI